MSYVKGVLPYAKVPKFLEYLTRQGFTVTAGKGIFEMGQVLLDSKFVAITTTAKKVVGHPEALHEHVLQFLREALDNPVPVDHNDTQRLDFMLCKCRKVCVEALYNGNHEIYVEEGFMGEKKYPAALALDSGDIKWNSPEGMALKRQAIDLAIKHQ